MVDAARAWLADLTDEQRNKARSPWPSDEERHRGYYTPTDHGGLPLAPMHHFHHGHLSRSSTKTIVGVRIAGRRVSNRTFLHVPEGTIHGSRKRTRDRPTSTATF